MGEGRESGLGSECGFTGLWFCRNAVELYNIVLIFLRSLSRFEGLFFAGVSRLFLVGRFCSSLGVFVHRLETVVVARPCFIVQFATFL
jgi:hypothetical protein